MKLCPKRFQRNTLGRGIAVVILVFTCFLIWQFASAMETVVLQPLLIIGGIGGILALLCLLADWTSNRKAHDVLALYKELQQAPTVRGEIMEIRKQLYYFGNPITEEAARGKSHKNIRTEYRMAVSWVNPETGEAETFVSDAYSEDLEVLLGGNAVTVHYTATGEKLVEPLEFRESMHDAALEESGGEFRYLLETHTVAVIMTMLGVSIVIAVILLKVTGVLDIIFGG